ncbi:MAG: putative tRNA ((1)-)-methyltransferase [Actinomycetota bacterium]|jgi:tRNA (adenine57-N1/adenine58-N1)-methyltransferase catalytic subunit
MSAPFAEGEKALFVDSKQRRYLVTLNVEGEFHSHSGFIPHTAVIGAQPGIVSETTKGAKYIVLRPTLEDFVIEMPRGAQVIYPKDLAPMCMIGDIHPGVRVFETGIGSGALSMTMLRWGAHITGIELREDFMNRATANVRSFLGESALDRYNVSLGDSYECPPEGEFDRVMLDLPEPWRVVPHAEKVLVRGGLLVAYTPSITQAVQVRESFGKGWVDQRTLEVLHRTWHIEGMSVRPDHRMVAHTAFLTVARFTGE